MNLGRKYLITVNGKTRPVTVIDRCANQVTFEIEGQRYEASISAEGTIQTNLAFGSAAFGSAAFSSAAFSSAAFSSAAPSVTLNPAALGKSSENSNSANGLLAPMPGLVVSIAVKEGDLVSAGLPAVVLEAMKMENALNFTNAGKVKKVLIKPGDQVESGQLLVEIEPC